MSLGFFLSGDLGQMGAQAELLSDNRIPLTYSNVYPIVPSDRLKEAMQLIFENRVDGWWHYRDEYEKYGICSGDEFDAKLHGGSSMVERAVERMKQLISRRMDKPVIFEE